MKFRIATIFSVTIFFGSVQVQASGIPKTQSFPVWQQQISVAVDEFMSSWSTQARISQQTDIEYSIGSLDSRLNFPPCQQTPTVESNREARAGKLTVKVSCETGKRWSLYVPLEIRRMHPVVFLSNTLPRMASISQGDLTLKKANIDELGYGYFTTLEDAAGMIARRTLNAGEPLAPNQVSPPKLVNKGDAVLIEASNDSISVKMPGLAMADGRKGQQIPVKNTQSQRLIRAKVVANGLVKVPL
ncbi:flagellar basal body P-ring formation chaperone FlgA [Hahella ganghwensis]|uniref:flagellar basal body P-ring formation chaperone FlgA n=1 Tax=Hahella ganghwensis TaxID=286420 RepID=UPI000382604F|nr:flagellar basal body P-ring formation chaperone FlgA [Hahella ganghwensis]